jgi:hypothetical protein
MAATPPSAGPGVERRVQRLQRALERATRRRKGLPAPQVLLLRRGITTAEGEVRVSAEEEIRRLIGADDIEAWVEAGAPIDT